MSKIYHILGSDIFHHNSTLLAFFQDRLCPLLAAQTHHFYVVSRTPLDCYSLPITRFSSKRAIAQALSTLAKAEPQAKFVLHGQFNIWIWFALFCGKLPACRVAWHIWGADLYEVSSDWKFRLLYPFRRRIQRKIRRIWATQGDLNFIWQHLRPKTEADRLLYFPTKIRAMMPLRKEGNVSVNQETESNLTILLGNSGDCSNNHFQAMCHIYCRFGRNVRLIIPMGYPTRNEHYIEQVERYAKRLFPAENLHILSDVLSFSAYQQLLITCDFGYFNFERQQGIGTLCLLLQAGIPFVLNPKNPFIDDLQANGVPFLQQDNLSRTNIAAVKSALSGLDMTQLDFFPEKYTVQWQACLATFL